ncbi:MAG: SUMF1/EgtB/PvdO family nonheme iron enzyme [Myxococcales bacterium]|nr:SUMF1/EgtB/PvdO family nonheme iron enzyme [Polyangiaceae bacterium]MDW8250588.1 SUMF1/EgtB/PvdO family nonheme iron enzyme [Myxococcales bacterium]
MHTRAVLLVPLAVLVACSAATTPPQDTPTPPATYVAAPVPSPEPVVPEIPTASAPASASAAPVTSAATPPVPSVTGLKRVDEALARSANSCPENMILIDGDYCTEVEQKCIRGWYDKYNKKDICEEFEAPTRCKGATVKKRFCIDTFPWPGQVGVRPEVMNNFYQAMVKCAAVGKRMCTESEWTMACEGPERKPFPYGYKRDPTKCNGDQKWDDPQMKKVAQRDPKELTRLWKGVPNGAQPECISDYGVPDLPGNTDDVVFNDSYKKGGLHAKFDSVHTGGPWYKGVRNACRPKVYTHDEGFYYYFLGFRCCAEADGKPTDPRSPRMIEAGKSFQEVERLARFTIPQMQEKLKLKAEGKCVCKDKDILCKTMCGTLWGPGLKDIDLTAPRED